MELKVLSPLYGGMSLARDDKVFFVKGAIPDETVDAQIIEKKRDYYITRATSIIEPSPYRQSPPCPVFGLCGGCHYQHIAYEKQLSMKQEILCDCLRRIGKFDEVNLEKAIHGDQFNYRYRAQFKIQNGRIGFFMENSHEVVEFKKCLLLDPVLNNTLEILKHIDIPPGITEITLTAGDEIIAYIPSGNVSRDFLLSMIEKQVVSGVIAGNGESAGIKSTEFRLGALRYTVSAQSFFQSNWALNDRLSDLIAEILGPQQTLNGDKRDTDIARPAKYGSLLDIYGGAGNFSLPISNMFKKVTVIEENPFSIEDGIRNAELDGVQNMHFIQSTAEEIKVRGKFDVIIIDPPRIGLTAQIMKKLMELAPEQLLYISCNPATLSRDAAKLRDMYNLDYIRLIDMFPQTFHCEIFCRFRLK
ncbi:23S rRNA (uracil-C(5))-methyltransferase RlmCD [bacterium BMS3Abin07]|nr:23S rRNA (uracil-C(5))-methyltransferase RlmCD [bacterium BMS3Abin07]GBE32381.1 23S rRNA (uracil-C(5))-methyltransferase RlmCD [bacterium BMS3Bbin05]HDL19869.1 class I SAM-dependent RNA methyltransferase [Nitrospirota bacterium]HDO21262.1 class I SAM-dependent RNA methyltransferase [Nitrospirota bacterium]HDZ87276.1 class I SAM-dependent RNA methyltransferase [Nitrospirota bacterium]